MQVHGHAHVQQQVDALGGVPDAVHTSERLGHAHRLHALDRDHHVTLSVSPCMQPSERHGRQGTGRQPPSPRGPGAGGRTGADAWEACSSQHPLRELAVVALWREAVPKDAFGA